MDESKSRYRRATPVENMELLYARLNEKMSPAERRELQEVITLLKSFAHPDVADAVSERGERVEQHFVNMRISYAGFSYGMGSEDGISGLRRAIERNGHD